LEGAERISLAAEKDGHRLNGTLDLLLRMVMVGSVCFALS